MSTDVVAPATEAGVKPKPSELIIPRLSFSESMSLIQKTKLVGGVPIPEHLLGDQAEGLDMIGGMVKPLRLRVVQSMSKELKALGFAEGDVVVTPINVKIGDKSNPFQAIILLSWADYLCLNPRGCGLFWIRSQSADIRSMEAQKARKFVKEPLPEGGKDSKGVPYQLEYVKACNFILWLPEHNIAAIATWMKGECKYGEAFASLMMARGMSVYNSMYELSVNQRTNARNETWDGLTASNSKFNRSFTPEDIKPAMAGMYSYYREQWAAQNIDAGYDDMTDPQENAGSEKVDTSEY